MGRMAGEQNGNAFVCMRTNDKLTHKVVYTVALFSLPTTITEVAAILRMACENVFAKAILRNFFH
jgi:hypothetical protein